MTGYRRLAPVITPDGEGLLFEQSADGKLLLCSRRITNPDGKTSRPAYRLYRVQDVRIAVESLPAMPGVQGLYAP